MLRLMGSQRVGHDRATELKYLMNRSWLTFSGENFDNMNLKFFKCTH